MTALPERFATVSEEEREGLTRLIALGVVSEETFEAVYCADIDDGDPERDPTCDGWSPPVPHDEPVCPGCQRYLFWEPAHVRPRYRVQVERAGVERWLEARLGAEGSVTRLPGGVAWRVAFDGQEVVVAVLDWSEDARWTQAERLTVDPTVLVLVWPERYRTRLRPGVVAVDLPALLGGGALRPALDASLTARVELAPQRAWLPVHTLPTRTQLRVLGAHRLEAREDGVWFDGVVVARGPGGAVPMVRWLAVRHAEDVLAGKAPDDHCWWTAEEIAAGLNEEAEAARRARPLRGGEQDARFTREQVKRALARFAVGVRDAMLAEVGIDDGEQGVESGRGGYRMSPAVYAGWR